MPDRPSKIITSARLDLILLTPEFLRASLNPSPENKKQAEALLGLHIPADWYVESALIRLRLGQINRQPEVQPWLLRAIALRHEGIMIGHIGFHSLPGPFYLRELAPDGIEMGYTVYSAYRRQGFASEACQALMDWAAQDRRVGQFVVSISPDNLPSLRLAHKLSFQRISEHMDEEDGLELIFARPAHKPDQAASV